MKQTILLFFMAFMISLNAFGQTFTDGGIVYNVTSITLPYTAEVGLNPSYVGVATIPATVTDGTKTYDVTAIADNAFNGCSGLTGVTIPTSVTTLGHDAFASCLGLTSVVIPNSVTILPFNLFHMSGLTSVTIPNSISYIGTQAFAHTNLLSVTIPNSVTAIGESAFAGCSNLLSVTIPNSVSSMGWSVFAYCTNLISVTLPNMLTSIPPNTFYQCIYLSAITIPNSVTSIGNYAFGNCLSLLTVTIPNSVISIENKAFKGSGLISVTIPNSVTSIGSEAFQGTELTSVTIPNSVTSIGDYAFANTNNLTSVTVSWPVPLVINANVFDGLTTPNIPLIVPAGTETDYENDLVWTTFDPITAATPAPITLLSFTGSTQTTNNVINWVTSQEKNNAYFTIQHSQDAKSFTSLAKVNTKAINGNSNTELSYQLQDAQFNLGHNYYRLLQTDINGKTTTESKVIDLYRDANGNVVNLHPNPTTAIINVECLMITEGKTSLKLSDFSGRIIKEIQTVTTKGNNHIALDLQEVSAGMYNLQIFQNNKIISTQKVEKQ